MSPRWTARIALPQALNGKWLSPLQQHTSSPARRTRQTFSSTNSLSLEIGQEEPGAQLGEEDLDKNLRESDLTI